MKKNKNKTDNSEELQRTSTVNFKKAFSGFDVGEVIEYIEQQDNNFSTTCKMYDSKIDTYKSDIALLNRENESLKLQIEELKKQLKEFKEKNSEIMALSVAAFKKEKEKLGEIKLADHTQALIDEANEKAYNELNAANSKVEQLLSQIDLKDKTIKELSKRQDDTIQLENKIKQQVENNEMLTNKNLELSEQIKQSEMQIKSVNDENARLSEVVEDAKQMYAQIERLKTQADSYKQSAKDMQIELVENKEQLDALSLRFNNSKKTIETQESKINDLNEQIEKIEKINSELVENSMQQKRQAEEEKNQLITGYNTQISELKQSVQLHTYQFKQVQLDLGELGKHLAKAAETLESVNEK